ncbi:MAG: hypothetical protein U0S13_03945 [Mycobacterium sp.]
MNLESIERGLDWLARPKYLPGRLEMETQRGQRLALEIVSFKLRVPIGNLVLKFPVFMMIMPVDASRIRRPQSGPDDHTP